MAWSWHVSSFAARIGLKLILLMFLTILGVDGLAASSSPSRRVEKRETLFLPENNLWQEDVVSISQGITKAQFHSITIAAERYFGEMATEAGETFVLNRDWNDGTVNALSFRVGSSVEISVFGGIARRPEISPEGFAIILCHEISHAYGGEPYREEDNRISAEGQADYKSSQGCFRRLLPALAFPGFRAYDPQVGKVAALCLDKPHRDRHLCHAALMGSLSVARLSAAVRGEPEPRFETPDRAVVPQTLLRYPKTTQCRLDSMKAGHFDEPRPACWYTQNASFR